MNETAIQQAELEREEQMACDGYERYHEGLEGLADRGETDGARPCKRLTKGALPLVAERLGDTVPSKIEGNNNGDSLRALRAIDALGYDKAALIGLSVCWNMVASDLRRITISIGRKIEDELFLSKMQEKDPRGFVKIFKKARTKVRHRKRILKTHADVIGLKVEPWTQAMQARAGIIVLNAVLEASGLFDADENGIMVTEEATGFISETIEAEQWMRPLYQPMVSPPRDWTSAALKADEGPYLSDRINKSLKICRHYDPDVLKMIDKQLRNGRANKFLAALNHIQATPFRINKRVLETVKWAYNLNLGGEINKLPECSLVEVPEYPEDLSERDKKEQRRIVGEINEKKDLNRKIVSRALGYQSTIAQAEELAQFDRFYLPHNVDFRGRVYPIPHFNHQREDYVSAMFEFAEGKPLGRNGHYWLAVHLANCGEFDDVHKKPLDDRYLWVQTNEDIILECAEDPTDQTWWMLAEKPFKFLAACMEWAGYVREGKEYVSHLPVALDGSNSGLQHYAMALRSKDDAYHVNLCDTEEPQDVYMVVANAAANQVDQDAAEGVKEAKLWQKFGVTRKVVKRAVMTYGYSSEKYGFADQFDEDTMRPMRDKVSKGQLPEHPFGKFKTQAKACRYLAGVVWDAINRHIKAASIGMKFFKDIARVLAHEAKPVTWTTPVGFPVLHKYGEYEVKRVQLHVFDRAMDIVDAKSGDLVTDEGVFRRVRANIRTRPKRRLNKRKQKSAVAPNIIHSLDAAHLMLTVLDSYNNAGNRAFCMIHDSFATHAGATEEFSKQIRKSLVDMYENFNIFEQLYQTASAQLSPEGREKLPPLPPFGTLDYSEVRRARYSFC